MKPTQKITAVAAGGATATLITFVASYFGIDLPDTVAVGLASILSFGFGYLRGDQDDPGKHAVD